MEIRENVGRWGCFRGYRNRVSSGVTIAIKVRQRIWDERDSVEPEGVERSSSSAPRQSLAPMFSRIERET